MNHSRSARVGVIGGGIRGGMFARALQENPDAELVAICDRSPAVLSTMVEQLGVPGYARTEELLAAHPDLDGVVIATPDFAHRDAAVLCAGAGLDLMIEKPLATDVDDARAILDAADAAGVRVMVGFENRWNVRYSSVRDRLAADGDPRISAQIINLNDTIFVPTEMLSWSSKSSPAWFLMPHSLDLACWIGRTHPVSVYAVGARDRLADAGIDTWDRVNAVFTMADGSHVALNSSWVLPESMPSVFDFRYEIQSAGHVVHIDGADDGVIAYDAQRGQLVQSAVHERAGRIHGVPIDMVGDFVRLVRGEPVDVPDAHDGLLITAAIEAVHTALETGDVVSISV
ncbi:Gfo/Idh/MocA family protein [Microbacterium paraoxydans]|uniref:Gfo/Idh/MocA family oxidoreductase n=1 Tax=Microbacterium paraoxydans TaxID=199592 RepID=A0ABS5IKS5_9MICO|nr:Gfo/Idh/MocA family oxidoreductase [Microbacterium paraoxydans]MBS0022892.1 Gfo/Idh/MocA family oxidoreductase [Microbacterium paraoxydans]